MVGDIKKLLEAEKEKTLDSKDSTNVETNGGKFAITLIHVKLYVRGVIKSPVKFRRLIVFQIYHYLASGDDQRKRPLDDTAETTGMPVAKKPKNINVEEVDDIVCID